MAIEYGFTQQERNQYFNPEKVYSSWGRDFLNDFMVLYVYDLEGNFLISKIMGLDEVNLENDGDFIDLNVGQHMRDLGFSEGEYSITYKFLRRLAGRESTQFVDLKGLIYDQEVERDVVDGEVKFFKAKGDESDKSEREEVFIKEMKYQLVETSPDRTEFILQVDDKIKNAEYRYDFIEMGEMIQYNPVRKSNRGLIKFDTKDPHVLEFDIDPQDRGFTQNMVGGQIVIPNLYKVDGDEDTDNDDVVDDDDDDTPYLQGLLDDGAASDFLTDGISNKELIDILLNDPDPNEREIADGALQERGRGRGEF
tara:strand:- start:64 stop:990 length:927 start_codon:yes stop_codon:yes gene_type:complete